MKDFRQLKVWQRAHELTVAIYHVTAAFPRDEIYGLVSQMRRASCSIASNIAEGCGREGDAGLSHFCVMARGSASELEYQILLAYDLKMLPATPYEQLTQQAVEIKRMLTVLVQKLSTERPQGTDSPLNEVDVQWFNSLRRRRVRGAES